MKYKLKELSRFFARSKFIKIIKFGYEPDIPERNILLGYMVYSVVGLLLLMLPFARRGGAGWLCIYAIRPRGYPHTCAVGCIGLHDLEFLYYI